MRQLASGLIVSDQTWDEVTSSPTTKAERDRIRDYRHELKRIMAKPWHDEDAVKGALSLAAEAAQFSVELVDRYDLFDDREEKGRRPDTDPLVRVALELDELGTVIKLAMWTAHRWYQQTGREMPYQDWVSLNRPNLGQQDGQRMRPDHFVPV